MISTRLVRGAFCAIHLSPALERCLSTTTFTSVRASMSTATGMTARNMDVGTASAKKAIAAIAQQTSTGNKLTNLCDVSRCAYLAKQANASMLFLPECTGFIGEGSAQTLENAEIIADEGGDDVLKLKNADTVSDLLTSIVNGEQVSSETIEASTTSGQASGDTRGLNDGVFLMDGLRTIAREASIWISAGGVHIVAETNDDGSTKRVHNAHIIIDDNGNIRCRYDKIHLFDISIPGKRDYHESATTAPGNRLAVCDSPVGKLGISTCYDMRFPEMYTRLVEDMGAQILLAPSAFTTPTGMAHWHTLLRARAIESQCYMLAAAQVGQSNARRQSFGHALAVDPWGRVLADAGGYRYGDDVHGESTLEDGVADNTPCIVTCEIDLGLVESVRTNMPITMHRKAAADAEASSD